MAGKEAQVTIKNLRIAPKKVIPWLRKFKGKTIDEAETICYQMNNKAAKLIRKTLVAGQSAAGDKEMDEDKLYVKEFVCQTGPTMKRQLIRSRGRADVIRKRSSNLKLIIGEKRSGKKSDKDSKKI